MTDTTNHSPSGTSERSVSGTSRRRRIKWLIQFIIAAAVAWGLWRAVVQAWSYLQSNEAMADAGPPRFDGLAVAAVLYAASLLPAAAVLRRITTALQPRGHAAASLFIAAQLLGHVGKYVPGKALVVVLRVGVLRRGGFATIPASIAVFVETFLMMAIGAVWAGLILVGLGIFGAAINGWIVGAGGLVAAAALIPTLPPVLCRVAARLTDADADSLRQTLTWSLMRRLWGLTSIGWFFVAASYAVTVFSMPTFRLDAVLGHDAFLGHDAVTVATSKSLVSVVFVIAVSAAAIALAMVAGFASLLPGGAGVREWTLLSIMSLAVDPATAVLSAVVLRLIFLATELAMALISWAYLRGQHYNAAHE